MNENVDWNFANDNHSVSGPALRNHTGPANSIGSFYGLAIRKRKIQERQAHLSDESAIKPLLMGLFQDPVKTFPSVLFPCLMGK